MSTELDKAREALAEAGDTDMDNLGHLRVALTEVDRLTAALAEAEATIANERAQVAELQRLGASIHKAADAARRAERMDTLACGSNLVNEYLAKHGGGGDYCNALHRLIGMVACGAHTGAHEGAVTKEQG